MRRNLLTNRFEAAMFCTALMTCMVPRAHSELGGAAATNEAHHLPWNSLPLCTDIY